MFLLASKLLTPTGGISCPDCMGQWVWNGLSPYLIKLFLKKMKTYFLRSLCICPTLLGPAEEVKNYCLNMTFIWEIGFYFHDRFRQGLSQNYLSGWWFGTCFFPCHIWDVILPIDELIFFRGVGIPPTSCGSHCLNMWFINLCMLVLVNVSFPPAWDDRSLAHIFGVAQPPTGFKSLSCFYLYIHIYLYLYPALSC